MGQQYCSDMKLKKNQQTIFTDKTNQLSGQSADSQTRSSESPDIRSLNSQTDCVRQASEPQTDTALPEHQLRVTRETSACHQRQTWIKSSALALFASAKSFDIKYLS
jgi:hypothetical protein